eukprot:1610910-Rhodomonas_salina.3
MLHQCRHGEAGAGHADVRSVMDTIAVLRVLRQQQTQRSKCTETGSSTHHQHWIRCGRCQGRCTRSVSEMSQRVHRRGGAGTGVVP